MILFPNTKLTFPIKLAIGTVLSVYLLTTANATQQLISAEELLEMNIEDLIKVKIVTIATGAKQTLAQAPAVATVITADDIEAMGATELDDVLETVPGLHVAKDPIGYHPIYIIRGIHSTYNPEVLMLVNGVPLKTLYLGNRGASWGGMPVHSIARIEIIRGPGSAVFGADAFAGVINIITKTKEDVKKSEMGLRTGSFQTQEAWVVHGGNYGGFDVALTLDYYTTAGQRKWIDMDAQTFYDRLFKTTASLAPGPVNLPLDRLDTHLEVSRGNWQLRTAYQDLRNLGNGAGTAQALDPSTRFANKQLEADLTYHHSQFAPQWDVTAQLSYLDTAFENTRNQILFPPGAFGGAYPQGFIGNTFASERHTRLDLSGFYSGLEKHTLRLGTGFHYGDLYRTKMVANFGMDPATGRPLPPDSPLVDSTDTPYVFMPEKSRQDWYLFLQDAWKFAETWELTAGIRYDDYSDFGTTFNPRLAVVWQTTANFTSKLLYGQAFRAPAFVELYQTNNPVALGNPDLKPETIETWELAVDYRPQENLRFALNLFNYQIKDAIRFLPGVTTDIFTAQNSGSRTGRGVELETQWKWSNILNLTGHYAFQRSIDEKSDQDAGYAPHHQVYLRTDWQVWPKWLVDTQVNWVAGRERVFGDPRPPVDDYTTVDLTLRRQALKDHWNLAVAVRNVFDVDAREPSPGPDTSGIIGIPHDLPLAGRSYFMELRYRF